MISFFLPARRCFPILLFLLSTLAHAQVHRRAAPKIRSSSDTSLVQLNQLVVAQQDALTNDDPVRIADTSRSLSAYLLGESAKLRILEGKDSDAPELYRKSLALDDSPTVRLALASSLLRTKHPLDAASEATIVLQADSKNVSALSVKGSALRAAGDERGAVEAFSQALKIQPDVHIAYALGSALLALHEKAKADQIFQQIISASGNSAIWHVAVGDAYREALYQKDAVAEFKQAIAIDPSVGHAEFFLGLVYLQMNEWGPNSQSFEHLRAAVRQAPREYISNFYLGALESTDGSDLASSNRHLHVAAEADPGSPEVWLYLGLNAVRAKDTVAAKVYLRKAVALTGSDEQRNNYQIRRVYAVLGRILITEGNRAEGEELLARYKRSEQKSLGNSAATIADAAGGDASRAALSALPTPAAPIAEDASKGGTVAKKNFTDEQGTSSETKRERSAAESQLGELLARSFNDLGTAEARQGQYQPALEHFQEAERWAPPTAALLHNLGVAAFRLEDFKESARALGSLLGMQETGAAKSSVSDSNESAQNDRSHLMLAMSLFSLGQFKEAAAAFEPISTYALQDPRATYSWAYALAHSGKQQHANQITDVLTKQELPSDVMSLACHLYMDTESYEQSIACFRRAYAADPALKLAHYQVAESLVRLDRPAEAVTELQQELTLSPDNPDVQYSLAFALLQSSRKSDAVAVLQGLTAAHPTHAQAQYQLGKALLEQGDTGDAVQHLELAELNDPAPDYIHYQLQAAYRKAGRVGDADRELTLYRDIKARNREVAPQAH